jgi:hypothetical protein
MMPKLIALAAADASGPCPRSARRTFRRRHGVNVDAVGKGLFQLRDIGHMGEHAQFDLAVVGRDQHMALRR